MKRRTYVKPVTDNSDLFGWVVLELTLVESFADDLRRYGIGVAIHNALTMLGIVR